MASKITLVGILILILIHLFAQFISAQACSEIERNALLKFEGDLDDSDRLSSWTGDDCCKWRGVFCNQETGSVTKLDLRNPYDLLSVQTKIDFLDFQASGLSGKLNPSLLDLKHLEYLDLSMNNFENTSIPDFIGSLDTLTYLNLSLSSFVGFIPPHLGNLSNLHVLDLHASLLEFEIVILPSISVSNLDWISRLSSLQYLNLGYVNLSPASTTWLQAVNKLPSLHELHLPSCSLNHLPISLPVVNFSSNIRVINFRYNNFNSSIPRWLFNLCNLQTLSLSYNQISGGLDDFLGDFSKCNNISLEFLGLRSNNFSGNIPESLENLKNLKYLTLGENSFTGSIPASIGKLSNLEILQLSANQLTGPVPESIGQLNKLVMFYLGDNHFEGVISQNHFLQLENLREFTFSCRNKSTIFEVGQDWDPPFSSQLISISNCQIDRNSKFPSWLRTQEELTALALVDVGISDQIPEGIGLVMQGLKLLDLSDNSLTGTIPSSISVLPNLEALFLTNNQLSGDIPSLEISQQLLAIDLSANNLLGSIPSSVCLQPWLYLLNLSSNNLSGELPSCLGDLRNLKFIDLSRNHLQGEIRGDITFLSALSSLNLSWNQLTGNIPEKIGSLENLETLDFSHNHLSGPIPASMSSMTLLNHLNLSYNDFSGQIPTTNKFKTFNDPSIYEGNPKLCGPPLPTSCSKSTKDDHSTEDEDEDEDEPDRLWLSMLVGFLAGLLTVCSSLAIITSWRHAYFQFVDEIRDRIFSCFSRMSFSLKGKMYWQRL